jgi:hypothetical protein
MPTAVRQARRHGAPKTSAQLAHQSIDVARVDPEDQACLIASVESGEWLPEVAVGEFLDVVGCAIRGDARDFTAHREIQQRLTWVCDGYSDTGVASDVPNLLEAFGGVDQDVRTVGVDRYRVRNPGRQAFRLIGLLGRKGLARWQDARARQGPDHGHRRLPCAC